MVACPWCATNLDRGHCASCGKNLDPQWRVCPWCRTPVPEAEDGGGPTYGGAVGLPGNAQLTAIPQQVPMAAPHQLSG